MSTTQIPDSRANGAAEPSGPYIKPVGGLDPLDTIRPFRLDDDNNLFTTPGGSFPLDTSLGNSPGNGGNLSLGEREGLAAVTQGADIWLGTASSVPIPPGSGTQMNIVSTSPNDTSGGTGVREVRIEYLDSSGLEASETKILNGTTPITTSATDITFVNAIHAIDVGSNGVAVGDITIYKLSTPAEVYDMIAIGGNMSLTINYMVPSNKTLHLTGWAASVSGKDKRATLRLRATQRAGVVYPGVFLFIDSFNLMQSSNRNKFDPYIKIPSGAVIKVSGWVDSPDAGAYVSASLQGYLVNN